MADTSNLTPQQVADTVGSVVHSALIQAAGALETLRNANQALYDHDVPKAELVIRNYLAVWDTDQGVLVNLDAAIYSALPRGGDPVSYG